jgi:hypothetical protein
MVRLLATVRAAVKSTSAEAQMAFAGKLLCLVLDPVKAQYPEYTPRVRELRSLFSGIADSEDIRAQFLDTLTAPVMGASSLEEVIAQPFDTLFQVRLREGGA